MIGAKPLKLTLFPPCLSNNRALKYKLSEENALVLHLLRNNREIKFLTLEMSISLIRWRRDYIPEPGATLQLAAKCLTPIKIHVIFRTIYFTPVFRKELIYYKVKVI